MITNELIAILGPEYLEKVGAPVPMWARVGVSAANMAADVAYQNRDALLRSRADMITRQAAETRALMMAPIYEGFHRPVPLMLSASPTEGMMSGSSILVGADQGMVRLASAMGETLFNSMRLKEETEKEAAWGDVFQGGKSLIKGLGTNVAKRSVGAVKGVGNAAVGGVKNLGNKFVGGIENFGNGLNKVVQDTTKKITPVAGAPSLKDRFNTATKSLGNRLENKGFDLANPVSSRPAPPKVGPSAYRDAAPKTPTVGPKPNPNPVTQAQRPSASQSTAPQQAPGVKPVTGAPRLETPSKTVEPNGGAVQGPPPLPSPQVAKPAAPSMQPTPPVAPPPAPAVQPVTQPAGTPATPAAQPATPGTATNQPAAPGLIDQAEDGFNKFKQHAAITPGKLLALGAAGASLYGLHSLAKKGLGVMNQEAEPYQYNEGAAQPAQGINSAGYADMSAPRQF